MASQPLELIDDVVGEILARIPPDESAHLARASLVCKPWHRVVSGPSFARRYRELHRTPPLLGCLHTTECGGGRLFFPTAAACPFPRPSVPFDCCRWWDLDHRRMVALDCRHGRVLLRHLQTRNLLVWDPITGDREELPMPNIPWMCYSGMVLCAAAGCDHCDCVGGPFLIVLVSIRYRSAHGCVYSSEARAWGKPAVSLPLGKDGYSVDLKRAVLIGNNAYFVVLDGAKILKYNFDKNSLSAIDPPGAYGTNIIAMPTDDGSLGLAGISDSKLWLWARKVNPKGLTGWVQCRVMELEKLLLVNVIRRAKVIGFAEGVGVMFVRIDIGTFMIELKSGQVRKISESVEFNKVLPFMTFYTPGSAGSILPLPAEQNKHTL